MIRRGRNQKKLLVLTFYFLPPIFTLHAVISFCMDVAESITVLKYTKKILYG